ncbi:MAG: GNAT family N-acetyltransferase [Actinomycetota bacterium]
MARKAVPLKAGNLDDIPAQCRECVQWNMKTRDNVERLLREWGSCGFILYDDKKPAGFVLYGPAKYFPKSGLYPAAPVSKDAIFVSCLYVEPGARATGAGKRLLNAVEKDALNREFTALEALAGRDEDKPPAMPVEFFIANGFYILRDDRRHPLVRLEIASLAAWRDKAGEAFEKLTAKGAGKAPAKAPAII